MTNILQTSNLSIINQLIALLESMPFEQYQQPLKALHHSSIGQHTRHIVEFYQCLILGAALGEINYDARERKLAIEQDKFFAVNCLEKCVDQLLMIDGDKPLNMKAVLAGNEVVDLPTSLFRELNYLIEHTVHHLAIIKIGITESFEGFEIPKDFGVAHSTLLYRQGA